MSSWAAPDAALPSPPPPPSPPHYDSSYTDLPQPSEYTDDESAIGEEYDSQAVYDDDDEEEEDEYDDEAEETLLIQGHWELNRPRPPPPVSNTPTEELLASGDYNSVFKSRPKIPLSPPTSSMQGGPVRGLNILLDGEDEDEVMEDEDMEYIPSPLGL